MKDFKYDIVKLIRNVRDRPCIWDKTLENYKDRVERRNAWKEIFHELEENYEEMTPEQQHITGETIMTKWVHIRDTFNRSLRIRSGKPNKRKYILHNYLTFLKPSSEESNDDSIVPDEEPTTFEFKKEKTPARKKKLDCVDYNVEFVTKKIKSGSETSEENDNNATEELNNISFVGVDPENCARLMNEDEAFFASLLPTVVNYNEDERLLFRIEVLALMKTIRDKRNVTSDC